MLDVFEFALEPVRIKSDTLGPQQHVQVVTDNGGMRPESALVGMCQRQDDVVGTRQIEIGGRGIELLGRVHTQDGAVGQTHAIHETAVARRFVQHTRGFAPVEAHAGVGAPALEVVEFLEDHGGDDDLGA